MFDIRVFDDYIKEVNYDSNKLPLGLLSKEQISTGFKVLDNIYRELEALDNIDKQKLDNKTNRKVNEREFSNKLKGVKSGIIKRLNDLSSEYYSYIPYVFGMYHMRNFVIDNKEMYNKRIEELQQLYDMKLNSKALNNISKISDNSSKSLKINISQLKYNIENINQNVS